MNKRISKLVYCGIFIALGFLLPFLTMQNRQLGQMLCLMHIPVFVCGFMCGPYYGAACGLVLPLMRSLLLGMPLLFPDAVNMAFELATYGALSGIFYILLPKKLPYTYLALVLAMLGGRISYGIVAFITYSIAGLSFGIELYLTAAFITPWMGMSLHILLVVPLFTAIKALRKGTIDHSDRKKL